MSPLATGVLSLQPRSLGQSRSHSQIQSQEVKDNISYLFRRSSHKVTTFTMLGRTWGKRKPFCCAAVANAENISLVLGLTLVSPLISTLIKPLPSPLVTGLSWLFPDSGEFPSLILSRRPSPSTSWGASQLATPPSLSGNLQVKGLVLLILRQLTP